MDHHSSSPCSKCGRSLASSESVRLRAETVCEGCLRESVVHRIKANMARGTGRRSLTSARSPDGRSPLRMIVCLSGGPCSAVLLHSLVSAYSHARIPLDLSALHFVVDSAGRPPLDENLSAATDLARSLGVPLRVVTSSDLRAPCVLCPADSAWKSAACSVAREVGASAVISGASGTRIACRVVTLTAQGRGADVGNEAALVEESLCVGIRFFQPCKDLLDDELVVCARSLNLPHVPRGSNDGETVRGVCERFLRSVQSQHLQAAFTVVNTASQLVVRGPESPRCISCRSFLSSSESSSSNLCYPCQAPKTPHSVVP